jgi:phosphomannomutase/phosphoglucomutase
MIVNLSQKQKINPNIFRAYDIRGIYPDELNEKTAFKIALVFSFLYPKAKKIVLARDPRLSSPILKEAITKALLRAGKEIIDLGIASDPLFYFAIFHLHFDGGIMISGSHNPKEYNGLTLHIRKEGQKRSEDLIKKDLEKIKKAVLGKKDIKFSGRKGKKTTLDVSEDYIRYVISKVKLARPLKIVIDTGNGAMGYLPERVFRALGCQVKTIYAEPDGNFPNHLPDPYEKENLKDIKKEVLSQRADLGFAFDTDGDRVGLIDNQGRQVSGDACLFFLALQALQKKKGPIVHCMRVSKVFLDEMKKQGVKTYFSISHHGAVIEKILETKAIFGGEITYHFLFPQDYYLVDDALFSSLRIAEVASQKDDFAKYIDTLPRYEVSPEIFIPVADEKKFKLITELQQYLRENNHDFIDIDGARINFENGWALARVSNTSPFIKCRFEGKTKEDLTQIKKEALEIFKKAGIPVFEAGI